MSASLHKVVALDGARLGDWTDFHSTFAETMGFPSFYGKHMNAWIDCMTSLDEPEDGLVQQHPEAGGVLVLQIENARTLRDGAPEIWAALNECTAFVNHRKMVAGEAPVLALAYHA